MDIVINKNNNKINITIAGRLDTITAPQLESAISGQLDGITETEINMSDVEYISSSGLKVLLIIQKSIGPNKLKIIGANDYVMEIFEVTGFTDIFDIDEA